MGETSFSHDAYSARESHRRSTGTSAFVYDDAIKSGVFAAKCHDAMNPFGVNVRESRDSDAHPVTIPIVVGQDLTGSMGDVPKIFQKALSKIMSIFLEVKTSGKKYLGLGYPAIMTAGYDDYPAMRGQAGTVQFGQFESGLEIDDDLGRLWITGLGGGTRQESYGLFLYGIARHTVHDHWEKRGKKGYIFMFGDEMSYTTIRRDEVKAIYGDTLQGDLTLEEVIAEASQRYHIFYVMPKLTSYWNSPEHLAFWRERLEPEHVLLLDDPEKICELIASTVAMFEGNADLDDLLTDNVANGIGALVPLSRKMGDISKYDANTLPAVGGSTGGSSRV